MDADDMNSASANGKVHENGTGEEIPLTASTNGGRAGMNGILEIAATSNSSVEEVPDGSIADAESKFSTISKEPRAKVTDVSKGVKQLKGLSKAKNEKSVEVGNAGTVVKRSKEAKDTQSNGSLGSNLRTKQPSAPKIQNRLSIGREVADNHARPKPVVDGAAASKEQPEINDPPAPTVNMTDSDGLSEKKQLKPVRKVVVNKTAADENVQSALSPTEEDSKHRKPGTLPSYNFSFKCDERAAKRKEFYSKLEEKIQAKEEEKNSIQAKTKETQDAEIKKLRKKLAFKATPMPNFYQEPPPPTPELKKIPTTRAKSPKLGRKKSSPTRDESEGKDLSISISHRPAAGRLSLDEKSTRTVKVVVGGGGASSVQPKRPQRKSLPKLPSQKTVLSNDQKSDTLTSSETTETTRIKAIPSEEHDDDESQESTLRTEDNSDDEEDIQEEEEEEDRAQIVFAPKPIALES
ncbi:protein WVD2-like 6 [Impatiens glandulifera]|uniref:protein WVD2-like 6 n=1 Tax=Impatiens glandulifera TaxID=253017 RepID=UPI001FB0A639|nr:protein WVD2-like 6 [Impatiens glandulifera]